MDEVILTKICACLSFFECFLQDIPNPPFVKRERKRFDKEMKPIPKLP